MFQFECCGVKDAVMNYMARPGTVQQYTSVSRSTCTCRNSISCPKVKLLNQISHKFGYMASKAMKTLVQLAEILPKPPAVHVHETFNAIKLYITVLYMQDY